MNYTSPENIVPLQQKHCDAFQEQLTEQQQKYFLSLPEETLRQVKTLWTGSNYAFELCCKFPDLLLDLIHHDKHVNVLQPEDFYQDLSDLLKECDSEEALMSLLRQFRQRHQLRIIYRDLNRLAVMTETTADVTAMADSCINLACDWLYKDCAKTLGTPWGADADEEPRQQFMTILGMGKLGAGELNLSSDIDLIFCYPCKGETRGGRRALTNQEFFIRLGQRLIKVLDTHTAEGFVFRVDMRLRPYGQSGALVLSYSAMEQYYQDQGRDWERYAMIKARVLAGDKNDGEYLSSMLRPFVFRRYIDFGAISALRDMKRMIQREVARRSLQENIKLGHGGIREIEFIVQSFQLIHGGRDRSLQQRPLLSVLASLEQSGYLPAEVCDDLKQANEFLRNVEHALQAYADKQTQNLPASPDEQERLACVMGFADWDSFYAELEQHRQRVINHFDAVITETEQSSPETNGWQDEWQALWVGQEEADDEIALLAQMGFQKPQETRKHLVALRDGKILKTVRRQSFERIEQFMPRLLQAVLLQEQPDEVLIRVLTIVEAVLRRTAYLVLLMENPGALKHLVSLCAASPSITEQIARQPVLLDEFLNLGSLYSPPDKAQLADDLRQQLAHIPEDDLETQMEALRYFRMSHMLRIAAAQVSGKMPLMKESDYLTWTAEAILGTVLTIAWRQLSAKHGNPGYHEGEEKPAFLIVGYGKLGGIELSPSSDLDLVFLHKGNPNRMSDGERPIENTIFFTRLGQRIVHMLNTSTVSGQLYEVDMRLRPSGNSGLLVSTLRAFDQYQQKEAWTWEHQALVRARSIVGDPELSQQFEETRQKILSAPRDQETLCAAVKDMRQKMAGSLATKETRAGTLPAAWSDEQVFHIKHDRGGIVDIEFMVQFAVLAWSGQHSQLAVWTDNIRILEQIGKSGLLAAEDVEILNKAYQRYRKTLHKQALQKQGSKVSGDKLHKHRREVIRIWNTMMRDDVACYG